jgi:hypothetical protein
MNIRFKIKPEAVTWLGSAFENKSRISPLDSVRVPGFQEEDKKSLIDQGIIDETGALTRRHTSFFKRLAKWIVSPDSGQQAHSGK